MSLIYIQGCITHYVYILVLFALGFLFRGSRVVVVVVVPPIDRKMATLIFYVLIKY